MFLGRKKRGKDGDYILLFKQGPPSRSGKTGTSGG